MYRMIFWDNDGVLVDTEPLFFRATAEVLRSQGVELSEATFKDISLTQGRSVFDLLADRADERKRAGLRSKRNDLFNEYLAAGVQLIDGVPEVLRELRARYRMAVVTSCRRDHFDTAHAHTNVRHHFEFVLSLEDYARTKPHPDPYLAALSRTGLEPTEVVVVEDSPRGVAAAVAAGLSCIVIPRGLTRDGDFGGARQVIGDVAELPATLDRLSG